MIRQLSSSMSNIINSTNSVVLSNSLILLYALLMCVVVGTEIIMDYIVESKLGRLISGPTFEEFIKNHPRHLVLNRSSNPRYYMAMRTLYYMKEHDKPKLYSLTATMIYANDLQRHLPTKNLVKKEGAMHQHYKDILSGVTYPGEYAIKCLDYMGHNS